MIDMPLRVNGLEVKVTPVAPLAMAQNMEEVNSIMQFMQLSQNLGTDGQLALKMDVMVDYLADKLGVPASVRNTAPERAVLMEEMRNQQQQQAIGQAMMMQAQAQAGAPGGMPAPQGMPA
jgi:hypothetical protein